MRTTLIAVLACLSTIAAAQNVPSFIGSELPGLVDTYKDIHEHPELSHFEARTSHILADAMRTAG
ncbi:MAG TPA: hypothetical protein VL990_08755 [Acidobacteriaceae bacterium]|nr:hypothetical protein [Acidobacteriaceae bacterium]